MGRLAGALALLLFAAPPLGAEAPESSLRPLARAVVANLAAEPPVGAAAVAIGAVPRPRARPAPLPLPPSAVAADTVEPPPPATVFSRLGRVRPEPRPDMAEPAVQTAAALRILPGRSAVVGRKGSVCGVAGIKGEPLAPITARLRGCGIAEPVRINSVAGVTLSTAATLDCPTARALHDWVQGALQPAFGRGKVAQLQVAAHYVCRSRNNVRGAPISEHGRGKAIDIAAIVLTNGKTVTVADDWRSRAGRPMVKAYRAACGTFGTTLGPDADRFHRNHMHFDTARHRNGAYCR